MVWARRRLVNPVLGIWSEVVVRGGEQRRMNARVSEGVRGSIPGMEPGLPRGKDHMEDYDTEDYEDYDEAQDDGIILEIAANIELKTANCSQYRILESDDLCRHYDVKMTATTQNTNNTTIRYKKKMKFVEQLVGPPDPETADPDTIDKCYESVNLK
ncbi:hypothetical protein Tco_0377793 [Tanacetum coccineum]